MSDAWLSAVCCAVLVAVMVALWPPHPVSAGVGVFLGLAAILYAIGATR